jgi:FkbM family methyltransferase
MKKFLKSLLGKLHLAEKLQYSRLYRSLRSKNFAEHIRKQDDFYIRTLGKNNSLMFDIGANLGDHTHVFNRLSSRVITVEPDARNCSILKKRFPGRNIVIVQKAISDSIGIATFHVEAAGSAYNTLSNKWVDVLENQDRSRYDASTKFGEHVSVETTTLDALITKYGKPDFIKIDVEGHELAAVKGLSVPVDMLSVECNLPEFRDETIAIVSHLHKLDNRYVFNYSNEYNFYLDRFISAEEMVRTLQATELRFFEMYCSLKPIHA